MNSDNPSPFLASVVILGYNAKEYLGDCLRSVLDQSLPASLYEILYADNGSTDGSADLVRSIFPRVRVVTFPENLGFAEGNNRAAKLAQGRYVVFLNQDVVVHQRWLEALTNAFDSTTENGVFCSNQVPVHAPEFQSMERRNNIESLYYLDLTCFGYARFTRKKFSPALVPSRFISGASFALPRAILERQQEIFDPDYFMYGEDLDLGLRLICQGIPIYYVPDSICYHAMGSGLYGEPPQMNLSQIRKAIRISANRYQSYFKNMYLFEFGLYFPFLMLGTPLKTLVGKWNMVNKIFGALFMAFLSIFAVVLFSWQAIRGLEKRNSILAQRTLPPFGLLRVIFLNPIAR